MFFFFSARRVQEILAVHSRAVHCYNNGGLSIDCCFRSDRIQVKFYSRRILVKICKILMYDLYYKFNLLFNWFTFYIIY